MNNWQTKKLNEICEKKSSNISRNQLDNEDGDYPIFGASGLIKKVSFFKRDKEYVSIVKDGAGIGRIALLPARSSVIGTLQYLIPKEDINIKFLFYILNSFDFSKYKNGSTIPHIYFREYSEEQFLIPPLSEQKRIVKILDEAFEKLEKAKRNLEKNLENSKELFESYLADVFNGLKKDWHICNLEEYIKLIDYRGRTPVKTNSGVRLITAKNVKLGYLQLEPQEFIASDNYDSWMTRGIPNFGDVIFTTEAPLANVAQIDTKDKVAFAQRIIVMQPDKKILDQTFLKYLLISNPIRNKILEKGTGATVQGIKSSLLKKIPIHFPKSFTEQKTIVKKLDQLSEQTKKLESIYQKKLANLEELKKSILQKAFRGEL